MDDTIPKPIGRPKTATPKKMLTLRLSAEVPDFFRETGPGWMSRIDKILVDHVNEEKRIRNLKKET